VLGQSAAWLSDDTLFLDLLSCEPAAAPEPLLQAGMPQRPALLVGANCLPAILAIRLFGRNRPGDEACAGRYRSSISRASSRHEGIFARQCNGVDVQNRR
jgi:hypothetical protein